MEKFKTKIVQKFSNGFEYYVLLLSDGRCVASGSLQHCCNERDRWERISCCKPVKPVQLSIEFEW